MTKIKLETCTGNELFESRVTLVVQDFLEHALTGHWEKVGQTTLFNSLLMLLQEPLVVCLYRIEHNGKLYVYDTLGDPALRSIFHLHLRRNIIKARKKDPRKFFLEETAEKNSFLESKEFSFGFTLHRKSFNGKGVIEFETLTSVSPSYKLLDCALARLQKEAETINLKLGKYLNDSRKGPEGIDKAVAPQLPELGEVSIPEPLDLSQITNRCFDEIERLINHEYESICASPILSRDGKIPPNVSFHIKYYDDQIRKHEVKPKIKSMPKGLDLKPKVTKYDYNLRWVIPPLQKSHLKLALQTCRSSRFTGHQFWCYEAKDVYGNSIKEEWNRCCEQDDLFWEQIMSDEGIDYILEKVSEPYSSKEKAFVDPCMEKGIVHIRKDPFIHQDGTLSERRLFKHYLTGAMSPDTEDSGVLMVPIRINGVVWACIATTTNYAFEKDGSGEPLMLVDHHTYMHNWYFYHAIARDVEGGLRRSIRQCFRDVIISILFDHMLELSDAYKKNKRIPDDLFREKVLELNRHLVSVSYVFPWPLIQLEIAQSGLRDIDYRVELLDPADGINHLPLRIKTFNSDGQLIPNPNFPKLGDYEFFRLEEAIKLFDQALGAVRYARKERTLELVRK